MAETVFKQKKKRKLLSSISTPKNTNRATERGVGAYRLAPCGQESPGSVLGGGRDSKKEKGDSYSGRPVSGGKIVSLSAVAQAKLLKGGRGEGRLGLKTGRERGWKGHSGDPGGLDGKGRGDFCAVRKKAIKDSKRAFCEISGGGKGFVVE